ncbi:MAG TPA: hypothetical protein VHL57_03830 [Flavobacteriales bacterium]|jgi:hypothetical protein|nr:hypothetical protein [Flavobacteriales bacterium]
MSELLANEVHRVLTEAAVFASTDDTLPMINCVQLTSTGTHLVAAATDRFALGVSATPCEGEKWSVLIPLEFVKLIGTTLLPNRRKIVRHCGLGVTPKLRKLFVKVVEPFKRGDEVWETTLEVPVRPSEGSNFPDWRKLLPTTVDNEHREVASVMGYNPELLARFAKVGGKYDRAKWFFRGPAKPVSVQVGENFVGLLMPLRLADGGWTLPDWMPK